MIGFRQQGIRRRLALLYTSIFSVGLSVFCALLFQYFQRTQMVAFDATLFNYAVDISANLEVDLLGRLIMVNPTVSEARKLFPFTSGNNYMEIRDARGQVLLHSRALEDKFLPLDTSTLLRLDGERAIFQTISAARLGLKSSTRDLRLITYPAQHAGWREPLILQIAVPLDLPEQERRDLLLFFLLGIPVFLIVSALAGIWMSRRALMPVHEMTLKAQSITGVEKLKERIPVPEARDEIHELAITFNGLLDRLDRAFASQDRFISNASHQLKTPLTVLKGELELLQKGPDRDPLTRAGLESASGEIDRLIQLVQDLLLLARLDAGRDTLALKPVRVDEALLKVVARLQNLARRKNVQITTHLSAEKTGMELEAEVMGDEDLLESMLENFVENAIKYSSPDSQVELMMKTHPRTVEVRVRDHGPGVPPEQRQKVFERFTRGEPSHIIPGSGLGLSIASEIARIHEATIDLRGAPGGEPGTVVTITFPKA